VDGSTNANSADRIISNYQYDVPAGLLKAVTNPDDQTVHYDYVPGSASWRLGTVTRANGSVYTNTYSDDSLQVRMSAAASAGSPALDMFIQYDGRKKSRRMSQASQTGVGNIQDIDYDDMGRIKRRSRPYLDGTTAPWVTYEYDGAGRLKSVTKPDASKAQYFYNESTSPDSVLKGEAAETLRSRDPWGRSRWITYDEQHNIRAVVEPNPTGNGDVFAPGSSVTRYYFDPFSRLKTVTQGKQSRLFFYDSLSRMVAQSLPERSNTLDLDGHYVGKGVVSNVFEYNDKSSLVSATDARGVKTIYSYGNDPLDRLQMVRYDITGIGSSSAEVLPAADIKYRYQTSGDVRRLRATITPGLVKEEFDYDLPGCGCVTASTLTFDAYHKSAFEIKYEFDALGRVKTLDYPTRSSSVSKSLAPSLGFSYTDKGFLDKVKLDGTVLADQTHYDSDGNLTGVRINTTAGFLEEAYEFDPVSGMMSGHKLTKTPFLSDGTLSTIHEQLVQLRYERRREGEPGVTGQITGVSDLLDSSKSEAFQYDALGRLESESFGAMGLLAHSGRVHGSLVKQEYRYDRYGNRTSVKAFSFGPPVSLGSEAPPERLELGQEERDGSGELVFDEKTNHITSPGFAYDEAGNLTLINRGDGFWQKYIYDAAGRMVRVTNLDGSLIEAYLYGSDNRRLGMSHDLSDWTYWIWDAHNRLSEFKHTHNSSPSVALEWSKDYFFVGQRLLLTQEPASIGVTRKFHHPGRLGTMAISSETGTSLQTFKQSTLPFGTDRTAPQSWQDSRRFTSYDRAAVSGLDYAGNRQYDARFGRFAQVDPLGMGAAAATNPQSLNMYTYVRNDPSNVVDPVGLKDSDIPDGGCFTDPEGVPFCVSDVVTVTAPLPSLSGGVGLLPGKGPRGPSGTASSGSRGRGTGTGIGEGREGRPRSKTGSKDPLEEAVDKRLGQILRCTQIRSQREAEFQKQVTTFKTDLRALSSNTGWGVTILGLADYDPTKALAATLSLYYLFLYTFAEDTVAMGNLQDNFNTVLGRGRGDQPSCEDR
jgi:RHS repeat-associated protein